MRRDRYNTGSVAYVHDCVQIGVLSFLVLDTISRNRGYKGSLGTVCFPVHRGDLLDGLSERFEGTELGVTFEVVSGCSASRKDHCIVLVPHSNV